MTSLLGRYTRFPKVLFRLSNGPAIRLRDLNSRRNPGSYDLQTEDGKVQPIGVTSDYFERPNGASMRGNTLTQQRLVSTFRGSDVRVFRVPAGTAVPEDLVLIHEHGEHFSLQPRVAMTLDELNTKITQFLATKSQCLTKDQWQQAYPDATE